MQSGGMAPSVYNFGATRGWAVDATPRPLYALERFGTGSSGYWMNLGDDLDGSGKRHPHGGSNPRPSGP